MQAWENLKTELGPKYGQQTGILIPNPLESRVHFGDKRNEAAAEINGVIES